MYLNVYFLRAYKTTVSLSRALNILVYYGFTYAKYINKNKYLYENLCTYKTIQKLHKSLIFAQSMCVCMVSCEITESAAMYCRLACAGFSVKNKYNYLFFPLRSKQFISQWSRSSQLYTLAQHTILIFIMLIVGAFQLRGLYTTRVDMDVNKIYIV